MSTATMTTYDKILLDVVASGEITKAFNDEVKLYDLATKSQKDWRGRQEIFDVQMTRGSGVGARAETGALPTPGAPTHVNGSVGIKRMFAVGELSHDVIVASKGAGASFRDALSDSLENSMLRLKKYANFCAFGDGKGILGTVTAGGTLKKEADETLEVTLDTTRYCETGDIVALWTSNSDTSTVLADGGQSGTDDYEAITVDSIASDTKLTLKRSLLASGDATVVKDNVLRLYGDKSGATAAQNEVPMGIGGMADDGTAVTTFEGISRTTYPRWKGLVIAASGMTEGTTLHKNHFIKLAHRIQRNGGIQPDVFVMDPTLMREFLAITDNDKRYAPVRENDPGFSERLVMTIGGKEVELFTDFDCPFGTLFGFNKSKLEYWVHTPLELDNSSGAVLKQAKPYGSASGVGDVFYYYMRMKGNWATRHPFAFGKITGLSYSSEIA